MTVAAAHPRQAERLRALRAYEILDTPRESDFDDIVALTSEICEAPISVVNLIDAERQWFKAEVGLGVRETPLATSLCSHVILEQDFTEIPDTLADPRMADNELCLAPPGEGLRFYAGALLRAPENGLPLGTLCVLDVRPRTLTPLQRNAIQVLARQVMTQLELRRALARAQHLRQEADHRVKNSLQSISALTRIQGMRADPETKAALAAVNNRIDAVATVHAMLDDRNENGRIDLGDFLERLVALLAEIAPAGVTIRTEMAPVTVSSAEAVAVGTMVNELAANAFKHAFGDGGGTVTVVCAREDDHVRITCADDGQGRTQGGDGPGLGTSILRMVELQLDAQLTYDNSTAGTRVTLSFRPNPG
ncbi:histidine kinase [Jannaschia sp. S6380]|uniref:sensor histidine kinase n=1 Tax=Jannaschia sp. S6380 TaxID=2926408 RepID=UPI001FF26D99|nr:histidine kinase dimerization/phosphoacceptor domain -containing protein [Jannaschia sp. S6380]MCK0168941.1 histidine kinase [Jannaschia sp. S6380]